MTHRRLVLALALALSACTPQGPTLEEATTLAERASGDDFTLVMNDVVYAQLQTYTGRRRDFVTAGLARRPDVAPPIEAALRREGLPHELIAVAFAESGFVNFPDRPPVHPAGMWQFIPKTARAYGLRVDAEHDDRLDPTLETEAAMHLLSDLHDRYGDWMLAFAAYNQGPTAVDHAIAARGTRDASELIRSGALTPYSADIMAAALIVEEPEALGF